MTSARSPRKRPRSSSTRSTSADYPVQGRRRGGAPRTCGMRTSTRRSGAPRGTVKTRRARRSKRDEARRGLRRRSRRQREAREGRAAREHRGVVPQRKARGRASTSTSRACSRASAKTRSTRATSTRATSTKATTRMRGGGGDEAKTDDESMAAVPIAERVVQ